MENILLSSKTLIDIKNNIANLSNKYQDFKFEDLDTIMVNISKNIYSNDDNSIVDIKYEIYQFIKIYQRHLEKKINRLVIIRNNDVNICYNLEIYINLQLEKNNIKQNVKIDGPDNLSSSTDTENIFNNISLENIDLSNNIITQPYNYNVSNIETFLINSDLAVNFNINLKKLSKILSSKGLYNSYDPDEHSGVNLKYYFNDLNSKQGFCTCDIHCATKEKYPVCTKVTILLFRPGSIIITGSRNIEHLKSAHSLILKLLEENMHTIKIFEDKEETEIRNIALLNNEFRKISRKPRLFYIKKNNIIMNTT